MKRIDGLTKKLIILVLIIAVMVAGVVACGKRTPDTTTGTTYKLTHTAADAEYILSWDSIVSKCPDIGAYDKEEVFIRRGESAQTTPGTPVLDDDSPAAWGIIRGVQMSPTREKVRDFSIWIMYFETDESLDELILTQMSGFPVQKVGEFLTGVVESKTSPMKSAQLLLAGKHFVVLIMESASSDESLFFSKEKLMELLPTIKSNISSLEITPLPPEIPERKLVEDTYEWHEFMTFRSEELSPPILVPEEHHYNDLIFSDRPLMQVFNFVIDKDWRFVITATGEAGTKFEVYTTVTSTGEAGLSYSSDQVFSLHSETVTVTREQPLEEGYEPPVNIEIKVFFDSPMTWTFTIESKQ